MGRFTTITKRIATAKAGVVFAMERTFTIYGEVSKSQ